jgi:hypothetical protein
MVAAGVLLAVWLVSVSLAATQNKALTRSTLASMHHSSEPHNPSLEMAQASALLQTAAPGGAQRSPVMVEDVFKNVQALKNIPVDEFMGTMGLMAAALGFCCNDCHPGAGTDKVRWEEDSPIKKTARQMTFMVQAINKENFQNRQVVTCWTCHRSRDFPLVTPTIDDLYGEANVKLDDVITPAKGVPPVQQIIDKYLQAIGGAAKVAGITSIVANGKSVGFGGFGGGGVVEFFAQAPDKRATYIHFPEAPERGDSTRTFDGQAGWLATPLTVVRKFPLTGGELDGARLDAQLIFPAQITKTLTNLRVGPPTDVIGKDVWLIQGNGARRSMASLYFDQQSGLLVRIVRYTPSAIGRVPTQIDYSDYRDVGGIKLPYRWTFGWLDGRDNFQFSEIKLNVPIDAAKFGEPNPMAAAAAAK